jgi:iron(III) transport system substrate-binding protein
MARRGAAMNRARLLGPGRRPAPPWPAVPALLAAVLVATLLVGGLLLTGCRAASDAIGGVPALTVYSGRNEALIGPLFDRFTESSGVPVRVRYGDSAELAATLLEEGARTPADVFVSQDAAALGALARQGRLVELPERLTGLLDDRFTSGADRLWVGLSGRVRAVAHHTDLPISELPQRLEQVTDPRFRGRFGVAPANASFQAHMAAYRVLHGAEALDRLLAGMAANQPRLFDKNTAIVEAVAAREIDWGLTNHYYVWRAREERPQTPVAVHFLTEGEGSSFVNLAGAAVLSGRSEAHDLLAFLLSPASQAYFAEQTFEYPVLPGVPAAAELLDHEGLRTPEIDFAEVAAVLEETLQAIRRSHLLR